MRESVSSPHEVPFDVIVIGASYGGVQALLDLLPSLPPNFATPIVVVQHRAAQYPYLLAEILGRQTPLRVVNAEQGALPEQGSIYLAIPGFHLAFDAGGRLDIVDGERVNFVKPSLDVLFHSAASVFGNRVLAVVLTGKGKDGAAGVAAIKAAGGVVITQDQASSKAFDMPRAAIKTQQIDFVLPLNSIGPALVTLTMRTGATNLFRVPSFPSFYRL